MKNTLPVYIRSLKLAGLLVLLVCSRLAGQEEKKLIREGNKLYSDQNFKEAENKYRKASELKPGDSRANFNLGDAYYKQGKFKEAAAAFEDLTKALPKDDPLAASANHNLGNSLLKEKKYEDCIAAYKKALTQNPSDEDSRYNLAYALQMLKQQQDRKKQDDKNKKDNKDKKDNKNNKDKKDDNKKDGQDKKKDDKDKKEGDKDKDKKDKQDPGKQEGRGGISKDAARKMLNEVDNKDRKVQAKLKKQKESSPDAKIEKDW